MPKKRQHHRRQQASAGFSAEDLARLSSYVSQILADRRPKDSVVDHGDHLSSGSINVREDGSWYRFSNCHGGGDALSLLVELHDGKVSTAHDYARNWLAGHPGFGEWDADSTAGRERDKRNAAHAQWLLDGWQSTADAPPAGLYFTGRGLSVQDGRDPVFYVPDAKPGKGMGAVVGSLSHLKDPAVWLGGLQLNVDALGAPELGKDGKKKLKLLYFVVPRDDEARAQAVFRIDPLPLPQPAPQDTTDEQGAGEAPQAPPDGLELAGLTILTEGLENALAVSRAAPFSTVLGIPGISRLRGLELAGSVTVMRDGDARDGPATKALIKGIDAQLLAGVKVRVTDTPLGRDAADYAKDGDWVGLRALLMAAKPAELSREGEIERLADMNALDYELARQAAADRMGVCVGVLDTLVLARRPVSVDSKELAATRAAEQAKAKAAGFIGQDDVWPAPVTNIADVCETMLIKVRTYWITTELNAAVAVVWVAQTHFIHHPVIYIEISPRLMIRGKTTVCGKTRALLVARLLCPRVRMDVSTTASSFADLANLLEMTLFLDEFDKLAKLHTEDELGRVILGSHEREFASVSKMISDADGNWHLHFRRVWLTFAGTCIGRLPNEQLESRCIFLDTVRASAGQQPARFPLRRCAVLTEGRQKIGRWAADLAELPEVQLPPELHNRDTDNWVPLMQVAAAIGGRFPALIEQAAMEALTTRDPPQDVNTAFLTDLHTIIQGKEWMWSETIAHELCALDEPARDWSRAYDGSPVTDIWVGRRLQHWLGSGQTERIDPTGGTGLGRKRGIRTSKLQPLFDTYIGTTHTQTDPPKTSVPSVHPSSDGKYADPDRKKRGTDGRPHPSRKREIRPTAGKPAATGRMGRIRKSPVQVSVQRKVKMPSTSVENLDSRTDGTDKMEGGKRGYVKTITHLGAGQPEVAKLSFAPVARKPSRAPRRSAKVNAKGVITVAKSKGRSAMAAGIAKAVDEVAAAIVGGAGAPSSTPPSVLSDEEAL